MNLNKKFKDMMNIKKSIVFCYEEKDWELVYPIDTH